MYRRRLQLNPVLLHIGRSSREHQHGHRLFSGSSSPGVACRAILDWFAVNSELFSGIHFSVCGGFHTAHSVRDARPRLAGMARGYRSPFILNDPTAILRYPTTQRQSPTPSFSTSALAGAVCALSRNVPTTREFAGSALAHSSPIVCSAHHVRCRPSRARRAGRSGWI